MKAIYKLALALAGLFALSQGAPATCVDDVNGKCIAELNVMKSLASHDNYSSTSSSRRGDDGLEPESVSLALEHFTTNYNTSTLAELINDCENESVADINETSDASPTVNDCNKLADEIPGGHTWYAGGKIQKTLKTYGTCAFGVTNRGARKTTAKIGNDDIRKIVWAAVAKNGRPDSKGVMRLAANGYMSCQQMLSSGWLPVDWSIYHTK